MRRTCFSLFLASLYAIDSSYGLNACLDSTSLEFQCGEGTTELLLSDCSLVDDDIEDITACIDSLGRSSLTEIDLTENGLSVLPDGMFGGLDNLLTLSLDENELTVLQDGIFDDLFKLNFLDLDQNILNTLPGGLFSDLGDLTRLSLATNDFRSLPEDTLAGLGSLQILRLRTSPNLTELPDAFLSHVPELKNLDLAYNGLMDLPSGFFSNNGNIEQLYLHVNEFTVLPADLFAPLEKLATLILVGNDDLECYPNSVATDTYISLPDDFTGGICGFCSNGFAGVQNYDICCSEECGVCGGVGCRNLPGGGDACCTSAISKSGVTCSESGDAPCIIDDFEGYLCTNGLVGVQTDDVCCAEACGECGGAGCRRRIGGRENCCIGVILESRVSCSESGQAPCIIDGD